MGIHSVERPSYDMIDEDGHLQPHTICLTLNDNLSSVEFSWKSNFPKWDRL